MRTLFVLVVRAICLLIAGYYGYTVHTQGHDSLSILDQLVFTLTLLVLIVEVIRAQPR